MPEKVYLTYDRIDEDCDTLAHIIRAAGAAGKYDSILPIPMGAYPIASRLSSILNIPVIDDPAKITSSAKTLIVDDLIDSGNTLLPYAENGFDTAVLYQKDDALVKSTYQVSEKKDGEWLVFPWEKETDIHSAIIRILQYIGEDPNRPGLKGTPKRIVDMWEEIYRGYNPEAAPKITVFDNDDDGLAVDEMVCDSGSFYSNCEHHNLPFFGKYAFAYIPSKKGKILGISKVARVVDYCAAKMQIQERIGGDVVAMLMDAIGEATGMAIAFEGEHLCKSMRGVKKKGTMRTQLLRGVFKEDPAARQEFIHYCDSVFKGGN